jgi:hypothetical protein
MTNLVFAATEPGQRPSGFPAWMWKLCRFCNSKQFFDRERILDETKCPVSCIDT